MGKQNNRNRNKNYFDNNRQNNENQTHTQQYNRPPKQPRYTGNKVNPMGDIGRMGKHAIGIFKDMARGKVRHAGEYTEFYNQEFIRGAMDEVVYKIRENSIYQYSLSATYAGTTDPQVISLIKKHTGAIEGWNYIYNALNQLLMTGDTTIVLGLINKLPDYRQVLY